MVLSLLLVMMLVQNDSSPFGPPTMAAAVQLANEHQDAEALAMFQRLAALNPNDREARLWIARLHERMGHPDLAEAVYRSVLLEDGTSVDAMLGVGTTLISQYRAKDAIPVLDRAERVAPQNADVLDALARAHTEVGEDTEAIDYYRRALATAPSRQRELALERARLAYEHRFEARYSFEHFNEPIPHSNIGDFGINIRLRDFLRVSGRGQVTRKFGITDERGGGGLEWRVIPSTTLIGHVLIGTENKVFPQGDYLGEIDYRYGPAAWIASVRYFDFFGARMTTVSPGVNWQATDRLWLGGRYFLSVTDTAFSISSIKGHTGHLRLSYEMHPRLRLNLGYSEGVPDFELLSIDQIGSFRAHTGLAGLRIDFPTRTTLTGTYELQKLQGVGHMGRVSAGFAQRF